MRNIRRSARALTACCFLLHGAGAAVGCVLFDQGESTIDASSGAGAGGSPSGVGSTSTTGTTSAGGAGGAGGGEPLECVSPVECEGITSECAERTCIDGVCGQRVLKPPGTASSWQTPGDCKLIVCGEDGSFSSSKDLGDIPDDENDCTIDYCMGAVPSHEHAPPGTPCGMDALLECDGAGSCHGCENALDCGLPGPCHGWSCLSGLCVKETALTEGSDCGACQTCQDGLCESAPEGTADSDCPNGGICSGLGVCQCANGIKDADEEGVDCGGDQCGPCQGLWQCEGACVVQACCSTCCEGGACLCADETAGCVALQEQPCATAGAVATFSSPLPGQDPACVTPDNVGGFGCASIACTCQ